MKSTLAIGLLASVTIVSWLAPAAWATPVTDTSNGAIYTLTVPVGANGVPVTDGDTVGPAGTFTYDISLKVDGSAFSVGGTVGQPVLDAVSIKIGPNLVETFAPSLDAAPGGIAKWNVILGQTNNAGGSAGCTGSTTNGKVCAEATSASNTVPVGSAGNVHIFVFDITLSQALTASNLDDPSFSSIKAIFCDSDTNGGPTCNGSLRFLSQTSIEAPLQGTTPVPEPMTMFLGGTGLAALAYAARKRLFRRGSLST